MNKHTKEQRLRSISHYLKEIELQKEALKVTESTLKDIAASMIDLFPFSVGDVIIRDGKIRKISRIEHACLSYEVVRIYLRAYRPESDGWSRYDSELIINLPEINDWTLIPNQNTQQ